MPSTVTDRIAGLSTSVAIKAPCRAATTANIVLAGAQTVDGIAVASGDRVLVKDQADAKQNGIYVAAASAWSRAPDFDGNRDVVTGTLIPVNSGAVSAGYIFRVTTANPIAIGASGLAFVPSTLTNAAISALWQGLLMETTIADVLTDFGFSPFFQTLIGEDSAMAVRGALGAEKAFAKGADIDSGATLTLGSDGNYFVVNGGTGPITAITAPAGMLFILRFAGAPTLAHHATNLNLPTGADIVAAAGDRLVGFATATNQVTAVAYLRASGQALAASGAQGGSFLANQFYPTF